jgi:hypothetical protein
MKKKPNPKCNLCGKEKEISFGGNGIQYPIFSCPDHGPDQKNEWEIWWTKYHDLYKDKNAWNNRADLPSCIIGYFCNEYQKFYGSSYVLDYSNPVPYKNKEFVIARRLLTMFGEDHMLIPEFIRWVFAKRVKTMKKAVTSFGFFSTPDFINSYKLARVNSLVLKRSSDLPEEFLDWCKRNCATIFDKQELKTWNDLNGLVIHVKNYGSANTEGAVVFKAIDLGLLNGLEQKALGD